MKKKAVPMPFFFAVRLDNPRFSWYRDMSKENSQSNQ